MLATRATAAKKTREKVANKQRNEHRASKVLAERNQAVVAVGAWVEDGQEFEEHPCVSARSLPCLPGTKCFPWTVCIFPPNLQLGRKKSPAIQQQSHENINGSRCQGWKKKKKTTTS
uniref:Uncharacterized protein n=1 Tax=Hippocampus comes TaxID=109280 RepID=A0A3Q3DMG2_HIPCM